MPPTLTRAIGRRQGVGWAKVIRVDGRQVLRPIPRWVIWAGLPAMVVLAGVAVWMLLAFAPDSAQLDAIRTGGTLGVGLGGAVALWLAVRKQRSTELDLLQKQEAHRLAEQVAADTREHQLRTAADAREDALARRVTEQYGKAVDQLGSERAPVRLGGLYALERLGQDHADGRLRQMIADVLCAYLRMPPDGTVEETQVRQAVQKIIANHLRPDADRHWPGLLLDFSGARLDLADFQNCQFDDVLFRGAKFAGFTRFSGAKFNCIVDFSEANFADNAHFTTVMFADDAYFTNTEFSGQVIFNEAKFGGFTSFADAKFRSIFMLCRSKIFNIASFSRTYFQSGVEILSTKFSETAMFDDARFSKTAHFNKSEFAVPPYFRGGRARPDQKNPAAHSWPDGWKLGDPDDGWAPLIPAD